MERRKFIKDCSLFCLSGVGLSLLVESCQSVFYVPNVISEKKILIKKKDFSMHKFVLVKSEKLQHPIYLSKVGEDEYSAVLMLCTHKGCELNIAGNNLICPCHGAEFSNTGKVLNPPANQDLKTYGITTDNENIYIHL